MNADRRWLVLIDESSDRDVYRIGGMVMSAGGRRLLRADLDAVMDRAEREFGIPAATELHGFEMFQGHGAWRELSPRARIAVYGWALDAIAFRADAVLFEAVNRIAFERLYDGDRDNEHEAALDALLEVIQQRAVEQHQAAFVFADDCRFAASVVRSLEQSRRTQAVGRRGTVLDRILRIEFVDSEKNRQIQAIDLVTYLKQRISSGRDSGRPQVERANELLWDRVAHRVHHDRLWPQTLTLPA